MGEDEALVGAVVVSGLLDESEAVNLGVANETEVAVFGVVAAIGLFVLVVCEMSKRSRKR